MGTQTRARLSLAGLLLVTLLSFEMVFEAADYLGPALLGSFIAAVAVRLCRRWGGGSLLSFEISVAALFWYLAVVFQPKATLWGLPTPGAARSLATAVGEAYKASAVDFAPVPVRRGYVIMIVAAMWMATTVGEIAMSTWSRPAISTLPPLVLFSLAAVVGTGTGGALFLVLFLVALLACWEQETTSRVFAWGSGMAKGRPARKPAAVRERPDGKTRKGVLARQIAASSIGLSLIAPVLTPALGEGLLSWRNDTGESSSNGSGSGTRSLDLLVDIKPQLVEQSEAELFSVEADRPAYWRLATLAHFDGRTWQPLGESLVSTIGPISSEALPTPAREGRRLEQRITLSDLEPARLPAAVEPRVVEAPTPVLVGNESADLSLPDDLQLDGLTYGVISETIDPSYRDLQDAVIGPVQEPELVHVPQLSEEVRSLLHTWTIGASSPAEKLIAVQSHLREFRYSTEVDGVASTDYLTQFLTETRAGYCQQFATAFALLARALGYPARVSVGFLPGDQTPTPQGGLRFSVKGTHAHAWPEVYFEGYGWVAFEPTPRQGLAEQPAYTVSPADKEASKESAQQAGADAPAPGAAARRDAREAGGRGRPLPDQKAQGEHERYPGWRATFGRLVLTAALALGAWVLLVPLLKLFRGALRYRRAKDPAGRVAAAFAQFEDDAALMVEPRKASESAAAYGRRAVVDHCAPVRATSRLAGLYEAAQYSTDGATEEEATEARVLAGVLRRALWDKASPRDRTLWLLSPPRLGRPRSIDLLRKTFSTTLVS